MADDDRNLMAKAEKEVGDGFAAAYDNSGVDRSLIRWNLTQTPTQPIKVLEETLNTLATVRRIEPSR